MLLVFQFPIADIRAFVDDIALDRLPAPKWDAKYGDRQFLRGFGALRERTRRLTDSQADLLRFWNDQNTYACADNAIRFVNLNVINTTVLNKRRLNLRLVFRRLYFDGIAIGRFEIGFFINTRWQNAQESCIELDALYLSDLEEICLEVLRLSVEQYKIDYCNTFPQRLKRKSVIQPLIFAPGTATNYYLASTMPFARKDGQPINIKTYRPFVQAGRPILISLLNSSETADFINGLPKQRKLEQKSWLYQDISYNKARNERIGLFIITQHDDSLNDKDLRFIRRCLAILHTEYQGLKMVISLMQQNSVSIRRGSPCLAAFQRFTRQSVRHIRQLLNEISRKTPFAKTYLTDCGICDGFDCLLGELEGFNMADDSEVSSQFLQEALQKQNRINLEALFKETKQLIKQTPLIVNNGVLTMNPTINILGNNYGNVAHNMEHCTNTINIIPDTNLKNELERLQSIVSDILTAPDCSQEVAECISGSLKYFIDEATAPKPNSSILKSFGSLLVDTAQGTGAFLTSLSQCITSIYSVLRMII